MTDSRDIDHILRNWPYEPDAVNVRLIKGSDGRDVLQMRIEMGILQLETEGRPDGSRPHGAETYYDYLIGRTIRDEPDLVLTEEQCSEVDREFIQFYHRRICWLSLRRYRHAVDDSDHTLGLMDFCQRHSPDEHWTLTHEQYRPFVLFHRTQAAALAELDEKGPERAVQEINRGLDRIRGVFAEHDAEDAFDEDELVDQLVHMRESLREEYDVGRTLEEQLHDAVASEQYELAARLRDKLNQRNDRR